MDVRRKLNIMYLTIGLGKGGRRSCIQRLANALDREQFNPFVACLDKCDCEEDFLKSLHCPVQFLDRQPGLDLRLILRLRRELLADKIDVIHMQDGASQLYGCLAAKLAGRHVRTVYTFHRGTGQDTDSLKNRVLNTILGRFIDQLISVSEERRRHYLATSRLPAHKMITVHNGIDCADFERNEGTRSRLRAQLGVGAQTRVIGTVANLIPVKNHGNLIRAFAQVVGRVENVKLVLIGQGPLEGELRQLCRDLAVEDKVIFLGHQPNIHEWMSAFDLFALVSFADAFATVFLEAMAAGLPIIGNNTGGTPESVADGVNGVLVDPRDVAAIASTLQRILESPGEAQMMARASLERAIRLFDLRPYVDWHQNLYRGLTLDRCGRPVVAHVVLSLGVGGLEQVVVNLLSKLNNGAFQPIVCCLVEKGVWAQRLEQQGIPVFLVKKKPGLDVSLPFRLARFFQRKHVALIHSHNINPHLYSSVAALLSGIPLVHTKHGRNNPRDAKEILMNRLASRLTRRIIAVSDDARQVMTEVERIPIDKTLTIPNGLLVETFEKAGPGRLRKEFGFQDGDFVAGIVARLSFEKCHLLLLRALTIARMGCSNLKLLIVGDGSMEQEIRALIKDLELGDHVVLAGRRDDIPGILKAMDLFVLCSFTEGMSVSLQEAMAAGLPVVATDAGGNRELVVPGQTGWLVPPQDPERLAEAIGCCARSPELALAYGLAGQGRIRDHFSLSSMVGGYEALYEGILKPERAPWSRV